MEFVLGGFKNYGYMIFIGKVCCKVWGFIFNVCGSQQLNYEVMWQNVLDEFYYFLEECCIINVENLYFFIRYFVIKCFCIIFCIKQYGFVFDKCVVDFDFYKFYFYGYILILDNVDMVNVNLFMDL